MRAAWRLVCRMILAVTILCLTAAPAWAQSQLSPPLPWTLNPPVALLDFTGPCAFGWTMDSINVYMRTAGGDTKVATIPLAQPQTWSWSCPAEAGVYYFSIAAANGTVEGPRSQLIGFIVEPFPPPPAGPLILSGDPTSNNLVWTNNAPNATGNRIFRKVEACAGPGPLTVLTETPPEATAYTEPVGPGTYCYALKAFNPTGESVYSNLAERTISPLPLPLCAVGVTVKTTTKLNVRTAPGVTSPYAGLAQPSGALGVIVDGPVVVSLPAPETTWCKLDYATGADGWSSLGTSTTPYLVVVP